MRSNITYKRLSAICKVQNGFAFDSKLFTTDSNDMPLVRIRDIKTGATETFYKGAYSPEYILKNGDYIIGMDGEFNITEWNGGQALLNQRVCRVSITSEDVLPKYLLYFLPIPLKQIEDETPFVTVKHLSSKKLNDILVPIPSLSEQSRIVSELDLLSSVVSNKDSQIHYLDDLAVSIFYEMFGNPYNNVRWPEKTVEDCFSSIKNGANIKQTKGALGFPITRIETLSNGVFNRDRMGFADVFDIERYQSFLLKDGDILMSHINSKTYIGRSVVYRSAPGEMIIHGMNLLRLVSKNDVILPVYAKFFFDTPFFKDQVASIRKDAVNQSSMAVGDLKRLKIAVPPIEIQQQFVDKVNAIHSYQELIHTSLLDAKKLLESRLDRWFK